MSLRRFIVTTVLLACSTAYAFSASIPTEKADTVLLDDGSLYMGQIADSLFNGHGICIYADGTVYEGDWKDGMWDGKGTLVYPDGDVYKGEFKKHIKEGKGTYIYNTGARYDGDWKDDKFNGTGTLHFEDGGVYLGAFKDDLKHGYGQLISSNGRTTTGYFYYDDYLGMPSDTDISSDEKLTPELIEWGFRKMPFSARPETSFGLSYGNSGMAAVTMWVDYKYNYFWGMTLGYNVAPPTRGTNSGIGWQIYNDDVHMSGVYTAFTYLFDSGFRIGDLALGGAIGAGLEREYVNCRANGDPDRYKGSSVKYGSAYYKVVYRGERITYRCYLRYAIHINEEPKAFIYLGYGKSDKMFFGLGLRF